MRVVVELPRDNFIVETRQHQQQENEIGSLYFTIFFCPSRHYLNDRNNKDNNSKHRFLTVVLFPLLHGLEEQIPSIFILKLPLGMIHKVRHVY